MKILLYLDPWIDVSERPNFKVVWLQKFLSSTIRDMVAHANLINDFGVEIKLIYSDFVDSTNIKENYKFIDFVAIEQDSLKAIFDNFEDYLISQRSNECNTKFEALNHLIKDKLGDFVPDVIIPISSSAKHLKYAFPQSLILFNESGIFSRLPYPGSLYFDCYASMDESFLLRHKNELLALNCNEKEREFLEKIRQFFYPVIDKSNFYTVQLGIARKLYQKVILLSLQRFQSPLFRTQSTFKDQIEYLKYVFDNVDESIGIIVTEHSSDRILNCAPIHDYFKNKYKNFVYIPNTEIFPNSSQSILRMVDGVVTVSSTVGLQALLYQKPLFVPSQNSYLNAFADENDLKKIKSFFDEGQYKNKDGALYYLITRYYPTNKYFEDGQWFFNFVDRSLKRFKQGVDFSFYDKIDSDETLLQNICNPRYITMFEDTIRQLKDTELKQKKPRGIRRLYKKINKKFNSLRGKKN